MSLGSYTLLGSHCMNSSVGILFIMEPGIDGRARRTPHRRPSRDILVQTSSPRSLSLFSFFCSFPRDRMLFGDFSRCLAFSSDDETAAGLACSPGRGLCVCQDVPTRGTRRSRSKRSKVRNAAERQGHGQQIICSPSDSRQLFNTVGARRSC